MQGYIEKSLQIETADVEKINNFTRSEFSEDKLYAFTVALCNNDIDRDYEKFSVDSLYELSEKFIGKTGISDHSMKSSDQKARIFDAWVEKLDGKKTADGEDFYQLKAKAYMLKTDENMPFIAEIEAGIKKEVSISCSVEKSVCSICGNDKKHSSCQHYNGKNYDGKLAYSVLSGVKDAYEFSFVAVPAQIEAGVTKSYKNKGEDVSMNDIVNTLKSCDNQVVLSKLQAMELSTYIEKLDEEAKLGKQYKKNLTDEVVSLCAKAMPEMDLKIFSGVAQVMTTSELMSFKKAFMKKQAPESAVLQLKPAEKTTSGFNQFKI
ncbi:MAG: hypothetical protein NC213_08260 [Acetobacter sp.]|nr:hypothetical protein [Bacteroides sp.]MCM1341722.1 hypothetical protein [Acetobacter sp.]MCM1432339.1 hypothetical protein [Clostridiales bacterium]